MREKIVNLVRIALAALLCIAIVIGTKLEQANLQTMISAAEGLYATLSDYDFEGVAVDKYSEKVTLYDYKKKSDSSSILDYNEIVSIEADADQVEAIRKFKNIRSIYNGIFFATDIGWDGEWTGIFLSPSELPSTLDSYDAKRIREGLYWLPEVPYHVLCEA